MCQSAASGLEADSVLYAPYGLVVLTLASDDALYNPVDVADLVDWVAYYGITHPVLADPGYTIDPLYDPTGRTRPTYVLFAPGMVVDDIGGTSSITDAEIEAVLPIPYP